MLISTLLQVNCETDFVAKTEQFQNMVKDLTQATLDKHTAKSKKDLVSQTTQVCMCTQYHYLLKGGKQTL